MSFDARPARPQRIAIIGGGISGLASAYLLADEHQVTLFEASEYLGGHARTIVAGRNGDQPVDTGFIVFNYANYPHLTRMFNDLAVPVAKSNMSFGATINHGEVEYGLRNFSTLFAQRSNLWKPSFGRMLRDILHFNKRAERAAMDEDLSIGELVERLKLGQWFQQYYLMPLCGAIWSTPATDIRDFPARALLSFFRNHALLGLSGQHQWWTVDGGSVEYVRRLEADLKARGVTLNKGTPAHGVQRDGVESKVATKRGLETFDQVIFACHSDQALALLERPTEDEKRILGAMRYQDNAMTLHCDEGQMPRRRACWSSWIYKAELKGNTPSVGVTYWMNRLQNIPESDPLFVSLAPTEAVRDDCIYDQKTFRHPIFDKAALAAQGELHAIQGSNGTWFAGAYTRHGFHEDGFASAARIARQMDMIFA